MAVHDDVRAQPRGERRSGVPRRTVREGAVTRWHRPAGVLPILWVVMAALCVVGPTVRLAVDSVRDDASLPQVWLAEAARLVNLDGEANLPTYFSVMVLAALAAGLLVAAGLVRARGQQSWPLVLPGVVAAFLSLDELASLHEDLALVADALHVDGGLNFAWVVPGALVALVVGVLLLRAARSLSAPLRTRLLVAGTVYLGGALGVETLTSPMFRPTPVGAAEAPAQSVAYVLLNVAEEGLEMAGALIALWAVLRLLRVSMGPGGVLVDLAPDEPALRSVSGGSVTAP